MDGWPRPMTTKSQVNKAGKFVSKSNEDALGYDGALDIINNYRRAHAFPLNTLQMTLRRRAREVDSDVVVAQRIKRLPSIRKKLILRPNIGLSAMQDVGGCRAIVDGMSELTDLVESCLDSHWNHELLTRDDYVFELPRSSGYRSVHLVYAYRGSDEVWNGLKIELQLRTKLQHAWATAVETVDTFERQDLKSGRGDPQWQRFFALMSAEFADAEGSPRPEGLPDSLSERHAEIRDLNGRLRIAFRLDAYHLAMQDLKDTAQRHHLLELHVDSATSLLKVRSFSRLNAATQAYAMRERETTSDDGIDVVLVSVNSMTALQRAYPNYFADTEVFRAALNRVVQRR